MEVFYRLQTAKCLLSPDHCVSTLERCSLHIHYKPFEQNNAHSVFKSVDELSLSSETFQLTWCLEMITFVFVSSDKSNEFRTFKRKKT